MDVDLNALVVVDDIDDVCSCDSIYHSLIDDTLGGAQSPVPPVDPVIPSPMQSTFSVPEPDSLTFKDDRSYQRSRQRLKKADDISKAKRCVRCRQCRPWKSAGNEGQPKQKGRGLHAAFVEAEVESKLERSIELAEDDQHTAPAPATRNVSLIDLVKAPRKGSGMFSCLTFHDCIPYRILDKRFEMIGRPRQVLALDEFTEIDSTKFELEDWEHVEVEANRRKAMPPSYARVVANRA